METFIRSTWNKCSGRIVTAVDILIRKEWQKGKRLREWPTLEGSRWKILPPSRVSHVSDARLPSSAHRFLPLCLSFAVARYNSTYAVVFPLCYLPL